MKAKELKDLFAAVQDDIDVELSVGGVYAGPIVALPITKRAAVPFDVQLPDGFKMVFVDRQRVRDAVQAYMEEQGAVSPCMERVDGLTDVFMRFMP